MYRVIFFVIILAILFPNIIVAEDISELNDLKIAFIRDGDLWTLVNGEEKQITNTGRVYPTLQWSHDGTWLAYQIENSSEAQENGQQVEVWAYHIETREKKKIFYDGYSPLWSPSKNVIAFNAKGILNISNFKRFYNVASGVDSYTWLPDGSGFLLSSAGVLRPDGWTSAILYTKKVNDSYDDIILFGGVDHFFTLPKEVGVNNRKIIAVNTDKFEFSPSNKWISFIVSPTASWSMDSNMLCVISSEGEKFEVLDEVIFGVGEPKWAPTKDTIAYIAGGGRIVFGFKDKDLKIKEMPVSGSLTPQNYTELDFTWINDHSIVTSRVKEKEWSNDFNEHPLPSLYSVNIDNNMQERISKPPVGSGDYNPMSIQTAKKLIWFRGKSITDENRDIWISETNGANAKKWLGNVDVITLYDE